MEELDGIIKQYVDQEKPYQYIWLFGENYETSLEHCKAIYQEYNIIEGQPKNYISHSTDQILTDLYQIEVPSLYHQMLRRVDQLYTKDELKKMLPEPLWDDYLDYRNNRVIIFRY
jgi:hypothetical protein